MDKLTTKIILCGLIGVLYGALLRENVPYPDGWLPYPDGWLWLLVGCVVITGIVGAIVNALWRD